MKSKDPPSGPRSTPCSSEAKGYPEALATWTPGSVAVGSCLAIHSLSGAKKGRPAEAGPRYAEVR